jgi:hypothetical protein
VSQGTSCKDGRDAGYDRIKLLPIPNLSISVRGARRRINARCCSFLFVASLGRTLLAAASDSDFDLQKTARPGGSAHLFNDTAACNLLQYRIHFQAARKERQINKPRKQRQCGPECQPGHDYPFTLTREKDSIARPVVGLPMESAGRKVVKVVKINMFFFNWGSNGSSSLESERMR